MSVSSSSSSAQRQPTLSAPRFGIHPEAPVHSPARPHHHEHDDLSVSIPPAHAEEESTFKRHIRLSTENFVQFWQKNLHNGFKGKLLIALDIAMTLLALVPGLHFTLLFSPSVLAFLKGLILGRPL